MVYTVYLWYVVTALFFSGRRLLRQQEVRNGGDQPHLGALGSHSKELPKPLNEVP